jgi:hypothetical protein
MGDLHTLAFGFIEGWAAHREQIFLSFNGNPHYSAPVNRPARYADVRDFIQGYADFPPTMVQAVALWMTREEGNIDGFWLGFPKVL